MKIINPYRFGATPSANLLLDETGLGSAHAAYSVARKLRAGYAGSAFRVRRESDNTEQDIGFSSDVLDTSSLETFCSGTNGYVVTIYDQSGNGRDATQSTTGNQPTIVSSGTTITDGGKPAMYLGATSYLSTSPVTISTYTAASLMSVYHMESTAGTSNVKVAFSLGSITTPFAIRSGRVGNAAEENKQGVITSSSATAALSSVANTTQLIGVGFVNGTALSWYEDNNSEVTGSGTSWSQTTATPVIGARYDGGIPFKDGHIQESVAWVTDLEAYVGTIKSNVNAFYGIY